jgi:molybdopterin-guanine dinucleotide biosynthesis protein A
VLKNVYHRPLTTHHHQNSQFMTGLVLCGGQSSRMGTDKGLLKLQANSWAQTAVNKLLELQIPVLISVNKNQYAEYGTVFPPQQLIVDNESLRLKGPLCGVLTTHLQLPQEDLVVLACDMPLLEIGLVKELVIQYRLNDKNDAFIYTNDGEPEPLCGIYKSRGLAHILSLYHSGQLVKHSMKFMLEHVPTNTLTLSPEKKSSFRNFNAHAELNGL